MFLNLLSNVLCVNPFHQQMVRLVRAVYICKKVLNLIYFLVLCIQSYSLLRDWVSIICS